MDSQYVVLHRVGTGWTLHPRVDTDYAVASLTLLGNHLVFDYEPSWFMSEEEIKVALMLLKRALPGDLRDREVLI